MKQKHLFDHGPQSKSKMSLNGLADLLRLPAHLQRAHREDVSGALLAFLFHPNRGMWDLGTLFVVFFPIDEGVFWGSVL